MADALIIPEKFNPPALVSDVVAAMEEEGIDPSKVDPERIQWPTGGVPFFNVNGEAVKELVFINIFDHDCNAWWREKKTPNGENVPPTCSSFDGKIGHGDIGDGLESRPCATCPLNQYGTGTDQAGNPTRGKACKNMRRIFALMEDSVFPKIISAPPTSIKLFINFKANNILGKGLRSYNTLVGIALKTERKGNNDVAVAVPRVVGKLSPEMVEKVKAYSEQWKLRFKDISITNDDYQENTTSSTPNVDDLDLDTPTESIM